MFHAREKSSTVVLNEAFIAVAKVWLQMACSGLGDLSVMMPAFLVRHCVTCCMKSAHVVLLGVHAHICRRRLVFIVWRWVPSGEYMSVVSSVCVVQKRCVSVVLVFSRDISLSGLHGEYVMCRLVAKVGWQWDTNSLCEEGGDGCVSISRYSAALSW